MTFTQLLAELDATWREQPRHVRVLATRYYLGAETREDLERLTHPMPCHRDFCLDPVLTRQQVDFIVASR
jgi:hypothetical protein